jgi:hypothetical protein
MQHGAIPNTEAGRQIRRVKDCLHFVDREVAHQCLTVALCRDGVDLPDLFQSGWKTELDVPHEGLDCCQSGVAGRCVIAALLLNVGEEVEHQVGIDVLEAKLGRWFIQPLAGKHKQQPEGVGVSLAGVGAVTPLDWHVFAQEACNQGGDRCHGLFPSAISPSAAAAISVINSGVASRYQ